MIMGKVGFHKLRKNLITQWGFDLIRELEHEWTKERLAYPTLYVVTKPGRGFYSHLTAHPEIVLAKKVARILNPPSTQFRSVSSYKGQQITGVWVDET